MNYNVAYASLQFFDHAYETPLTTAWKQSDEHRSKDICKKYIQVAKEAIAYQARRVELSYGVDAPHIAFCHFGPVSEMCMEDILTNLQADGVVWSSLKEVDQHPIFRDYDKDYSRGGFLTDTLPDRIYWRLLRLAMRVIDRLRIGKESSLGLRLPYL